MNLYFDVTKCLDKLDAKQGSVKSVLGTLTEKDRSRGSALLIETLKYKPALTTIIERSKLLQSEKKELKSLNLALLLVHDLLFAKGIQAGDGPIKQSILRHKTRLNAELAKLKIQKGVTTNQGLSVQPSRTTPRYARVNTSLWTMQLAKLHFLSKGIRFQESPGDHTSGERVFWEDPHIPNLLVLPSEIKLHEDEAYLSGKLILQDKASCMPAVVLNPPAAAGATVIDATAAPGNKTSLLSALMRNKGKLYAFERDKNRFETLEKMTAKAGCRNVSCLNLDFLTVDPTTPEYVAATHILLDPSCSGSGIVNRLDHLLEQENSDSTEDRERLLKLSAFQLTMIRHAMKFPAVQRIVYSTCSIHTVENEEVVKDALASEEAKAAGFVLALKEEVIPSWPRRGNSDILGKQAESLIRCDPNEDETNGFFVSLFVRKGHQDEEASKVDVQIEEQRQHDKVKKKKRKQVQEVQESQPSSRKRRRKGDGGK